MSADGNREPRTEELQEPSDEKEPEEASTAPPESDTEPEPSGEAVGIGVIDDSGSDDREPAED